MAISHAQSLLLLFVFLFFLPAALGTALTFVNCERPIFSGVVNITKVEIIPYPIKYQDNPILKITGVTSKRLTGRKFHLIFGRRGSSKVSWIDMYNICDVTQCPVEPGPFVLTLAEFNFAQSDYRSNEYSVELGFDDPRPTPSPDMCAFFFFHATNVLENFRNTRIPDGVFVYKVEIFPFNATVNDNPVFRIHADTPKNISSSATVVAGMGFRSGIYYTSTSKRFKFCDITNHCPVVPGPFVLTFPHPYLYKMKASEYRVYVIITTHNGVKPVNMELYFWFSVSEA